MLGETADASDQAPDEFAEALALAVRVTGLLRRPVTPAPVPASTETAETTACR